ncbi:helix-turn-helix domain-containing protein [Streptomyces sp. ME02-8801-2C]|uniref:helix-turn-helix domain-containing protein n=1 Tax=Streptomyces sp. ME02-8801-2C TaxID=3028680 RepID=UPI0029BC4165|nr:helix-turn-helix domain-containing protein [Streptomyces sp. ME02-8801-2C]MDX3457025.1 helix-turn-helix domain-containing protein [Streptomyces sp. ME02-8801-2C]
MPVNADGLPETATPAPPPGLVTVGRYDEGPGYAVNRPQGADSWLFTWTTDGHGLLTQGAAGARADAGDLVVLGPGVPHRYQVGPGARHWRFWWAHCQARPSWTAWLSPYAVGDGLYVVAPVPATLHDRMATAFARMLSDARWPGGGAQPPGSPVDSASPAVPNGPIAVAHGTAAQELALCSLEEIVLLASAAARPLPARPGVDARVSRAEALIAADPAAAHTVRSLAEGVALSPSRFAHLFTEQLGRSPMRALREARLRHAARLLEATDLPVERVAVASGFASPFHFNRVFRERHGTPPGAYRALCRRVPAVTDSPIGLTAGSGHRCEGTGQLP